jgi:hypothetical protein
MEDKFRLNLALPPAHSNISSRCFVQTNKEEEEEADTI